MFSELSSVFHWSETNLPKENFILIKDTLKADGSFLLQYFVQLFLKGDHHVCFVAFDQNFGHYFNVSKKMGINLINAHSKGRFSFVNGLSAPYEWTDPVTDFGESSRLSSIDNAIPFSFNTKSSKNSLKQLYETIRKILDSKNDLHCSHCVIIDNLNYLLNVCMNVIEVADFVQYCTQLVQRQQQSSCFVTLIHEDAEENILPIKLLCYRASIVFSVDGFSSGYSKDIDGELSFILSKPRPNALPVLPAFHFKLFENSVKFQIVRKHELNL
jgi:archaellum biogenesis ATPase FlaH